MLRSYCEFFFSSPSLILSIVATHTHTPAQAPRGKVNTEAPHTPRARGVVPDRQEEQLGSLTQVSVWRCHTSEKTTKFILSLSLLIGHRCQNRSRCLCYQVSLHPLRHVMTRWEWLKQYKLHSHFSQERLARSAVSHLMISGGVVRSRVIPVSRQEC